MGMRRQLGRKRTATDREDKLGMYPATKSNRLIVIVIVIVIVLDSLLLPVRFNNWILMNSSEWLVRRTQLLLSSETTVEQPTPLLRIPEMSKSVQVIPSWLFAKVSS